MINDLYGGSINKRIRSTHEYTLNSTHSRTYKNKMSGSEIHSQPLLTFQSHVSPIRTYSTQSKIQKSRTEILTQALLACQNSTSRTRTHSTQRALRLYWTPEDRGYTNQETESVQLLMRLFPPLLLCDKAHHYRLYTRVDLHLTALARAVRCCCRHADAVTAPTRACCLWETCGTP